MSFYGARTAASPAGGAVNNQMSYYNKASATNLPNGPRDTISQLGWSNEGSLLSCTSWDNTVRVWQISAGFGSQIQAAAKVCMDAQAPLLCSTFGPSPNHLFVGCCDKTVKLYDLNASSSTPQVVAQHDQPVCSVAWNPIHNVIVTASWDGYVRMWDGKQQQPVWQQSVGGKIFRMGVHSPFLVTCDNFRNVNVSNLNTLFTGNAPQQPTKIVPPLQKLQSRSMGLFPDKEHELPGVAVGSVEGRVGICHFKQEHRNMNFSFKCHRQETRQGIQIYAVNTIDFHPKHGTFATGGADGSIVCWDKVNRQKLRAFDNMGNSVTDVKFNPTGNNLLAYAVSYDWSKGPDQQELNKGHQVYVHMVKDEDIRPRPKTTTRR
ncbi:mRNA export protein [Toxoplasma gondii ME49]|uniref:Poly(A) RNA export protein, putative n=28 Tax=Toxoplasma gondii TaxID=5811 RepID=B9PIC9_TOXGV|nr:mRNA export protein [Toxoplasma gondii ME49]EPR64449.1 mRNA export protein [Toxoplasma gondii GT1]ESS35918.1 mRNA export protein [Toxoplasma gondii VEG]KAF4642126.1 mRNA export protein [Toxoplasma gondii]EPT28575.1 mRNA export protein [Toxoplasma gondii ME49]CEL75186.1 TPA: poly(A) RNA export protein, putative [Toxoplasma gondii VEG]|eukprot:XP_002365868.1 mRNA export protein [Toxoplasma gondii ME49]